MRLLLIRHGESEGNANGVAQGHADLPLTERGRRQAEATAAALSGGSIARVVSSPLSRAHATASTIAAALGVGVEVDDDLIEHDVGAVSGLTWPEIRERFPDLAAAWSVGSRVPAPGEEPRDRFIARVSPFLERVRMTDGTTVAVAHGGVINAACYVVLQMDHRQRGAFAAGNCAITEFTTDRAGRLVLARHNDACHLDGVR
jgi:broad specificity phosphatase PhoE